MCRRENQELCKCFSRLGEGRDVHVVGLDSALNDTNGGDALDLHCLRRVNGIAIGISNIADTNSVINAHGVGHRGGPILRH